MEALRAERAHVPELCLVAVEDDEVIGHVFYSRARLESGHDVLALAPMAVLPEHQRSGVGRALVEASLERAMRTHYPLVVVVGHPSTTRASDSSRRRPRRGLPLEVPPEAWMVLPLPAHSRRPAGS